MTLRNARCLPRTRTLAVLAMLAQLALPAMAQDKLPGSDPAAANAAPPPAAKVPASVPDEASSYSVGLVFGNQLHSAGLGQDLSMDDLVRGLKDGLAGKVLSSEDKDHAMQMVRSGRDALVARNHAMAKEYLEKNSTAPGIVATNSGLQYQVIETGDTKLTSPALTDRVTVHYRGRLMDGTEFDSSDAHAQAATFSVGSVIKGWREALLMMKPGAKWRLFVPPELGYDQNSPPSVPPGSLLIFDVELLRIEPAQVIGPQTPKSPRSAKPSAAKPAAAKP